MCCQKRKKQVHDIESALCCGYGKGNRYEIECGYEIGIRLIAPQLSVQWLSLAYRRTRSGPRGC